MAVLIFLVFLAVFPCDVFADRNPRLRDVIFDNDNPQASVGILDGTLVQAGDLYEGRKVISFQPGAVVLQDEANQDTVKWLKKGNPKARLRQQALHLFIVNQMRAIYEAQIRYFHKFGKGYAKDLTTLIRQEFLDSGFQDAEKEGYLFEIVRTGRKKGNFFGARKEPFFKAVARPEGPPSGAFYFSVDELGQVRAGATEPLSFWGPVWDYSDHSGPPPNRYIGVEPR